MKMNKTLAAGLAVLSVALIAGLVVLVIAMGGGQGRGRNAGEALLPGALEGRGATGLTAASSASGPAGRASSTAGMTGSEADSSTRSSAPDGSTGDTSSRTTATSPTTFNADPVSPLDVDPGRVWASMPPPRRLLEMSGSLGSGGGDDTSEEFVRGARELRLTVTTRETAPVFDMEVQIAWTGAGLVQVNSRWDAPTGTQTRELWIARDTPYRLWVAGANVDYHITVDEI